MNYDKEYFLAYVYRVCEEMVNRQIIFQNRYLKEIEEFCGLIDVCTITYPEHNDRYLKQCLYNLEEKYDRGIITKDEYEKIIKKQYEEILEKVK